ncbi:type II toxin-antitoxin system RelE/ParE family toxin [Tepidibacillus infernus]|uniref:type II toxin-antitoxin system RelE/ParE family toxin n=1 Tax=Tepidibacillus TaxID=1494427 RepID=UPI00085315EE|nr:type II toxin-antitoxin system RelE/ParE family toxin [Tepidibacillus sp. HK-1]GBF10759.1 plasmid stabilization system protein [Tepidibacillus sp. HK-1]
MYKLKISPEAKDDLAQIKDYISKELGNPQAAINLVSKITKKIRGLTEYSGIGAPLSSVLDIQIDYRFLVCDNYLIFYRYEDGIVFVSRILYGRRNYTRILFGDLHEDEEI